MFGGDVETAALAAPEQEFAVGRERGIDLFRKGID
jgi:hypothetical protein